MIKISIKLDKRRRLNNGKFPLKYKIARKESALYISTGYELKEEEWDSKNEKVKLLADRRIINLKLAKRLAYINDKIITLQEEGKLRMYSNKSLLRYINNEKTEDEEKLSMFKTQLDAFLNTKENKTTIDIYRFTEKKIKEFCDYDILSLDNIDIDWLNSFEDFLKQQGNSKNTIAIRLRGVRAVINFAIKRGVLQNNIFKIFQIKSEETRKRSLTVEQLRILWNANLTKIRSKYRDIFFLVFFLMGINIIDLSRIKELENGRISYRRAKTGTLYDIKVEPEAMEIINRYKGKEKLVHFFEVGKDYKSFVTSLNHILGKICEGLNLPQISIYWARHSFATIAYEIGVPTDIIADCLGHKSEHKITEIYIKKDQQKIDDTNRKVIDYVLYNKKG